MSENVIKSIYPSVCPHCKGDLFVVSQVHQPMITNILTKDEIAEAKKQMLERMSEIKFIDDNEKEMAIKWVEDEKTIFGMGDLESLLKTMAMSQLSQKQDES